MGKIFYVDKSAFSTEEALKAILSKVYGIPNAVILRTKNGKPYVENGPFFSVSHTEKTLFIAFSSAQIGLDAELLSREINYASILKKFPSEECEEIACTQDFLKHWVVKESAVKYLGGTLARGLQSLSFFQNNLTYKGKELPVKLTFFELEGHILSVCSEEDFSNAEFIRLPTPLL